LRRIAIASAPPAPGNDEREQGEGAMASARVVLSSGFSRRYTGGVREFDIEARTMRDVLKTLDRMYPGLGEHLVEETTVAINGAIHDQPAYFQAVPPGCEIFFIPKLEGG
jgi:sulfur-carrier protein